MDDAFVKLFSYRNSKPITRCVEEGEVSRVLGSLAATKLLEEGNEFDTLTRRIEFETTGTQIEGIRDNDRRWSCPYHGLLLQRRLSIVPVPVI